MDGPIQCPFFYLILWLVPIDKKQNIKVSVRRSSHFFVCRVVIPLFACLDLAKQHCLLHFITQLFLEIKFC